MLRLEGRRRNPRPGGNWNHSMRSRVGAYSLTFTTVSEVRLLFIAAAANICIYMYEAVLAMIPCTTADAFRASFYVDLQASVALSETL